METQKLTILGELPDLNTIIAASKQHWAKYHAFKKRYTDYVALVAKMQLQPITESPVSISFDWYCKDKRKDKDNLSAGKKFILDGLIEAGILEGDGWKQISELHDTFRVDSQNPRIEITIQESN
jgi:Holliday junction resolvase RusA-like endonuclease